MCLFIFFYYYFFIFLAEIKILISKFTFAPRTSSGSLWELWCLPEPDSAPLLHFPLWSPRAVICGHTSQVSKSTKDEDTGLTVYVI